MNQSPVARGLFVQDEDTGSSPLAPLGLHALRLRMKPSRVIQPVRSPSFTQKIRASFEWGKVTPLSIPCSFHSGTYGCDNCGYLIALLGI